MTISLLFAPWRRAVAALEALLFLGLPFVRIGGQSALRFDVPTLRLHFFGTSIAMDEFFLVLLAALFLTFLFMALTTLLGRLWCGWACPQTVLSDLTAAIDRISDARWAGKALLYLPVLALSALVSASLIWYFVPPGEFVGMLGTSPVVRWIFITLTLVIFIDLAFIRRVFCKTVCPYARMQSVMFDDRTLLIAYDLALDKECMDCAACLRACPVGLDIRDGLNMACISCTGCIDACAIKRASKGKESLVGYHWGEPDRYTADRYTAESDSHKADAKNTLRFGLLMSLLASAVFLLMLVFGLATRADFAASLRLDEKFTASAQAPASSSFAVNAYILSIRNRTLKEAVYIVRSDEASLVIPEDIKLPPGGAGRFVLYASVPTTGGRTPPETITIEVASKGDATDAIEATSGVERLSVSFPLRQGKGER